MNPQQSVHETYVAALLAQYRAYQDAPDEEEKKRIGDSMFFANPVVWILYKHRAYQGTPQALNTWGDLVTHSMSHDGICKKRLSAVMTALANKGVGQFDLLLQMPLEEVALHPAIQSLLTHTVFTELWNFHEYYKEVGVVAKWKMYSLSA